ncbi:hypothetical protein ABBQ38_000957 [Trebouxia sp. C0009 RCD-2024]
MESSCHVSTTTACSVWRESNHSVTFSIPLRHTRECRARSQRCCSTARQGGRLGQASGPQTLLASQLHRVSPRHRRLRTRSRAVYAAASSTVKDPYHVLGVEISATDQLIKKAFKQKAKQLHPDVNKAPDAADRFMECKMAYQLLIDPAKRQQYDRRHQAGFDWGDFVDGIASGGAKQRKQDNGEPFYGFTDFLRDLDVDLKRWSDQVDKKGFKSLFDELYDAGLLAVGALEKGLGLSSEEIKRAASSRSTSTSGAANPGASSSDQQQSSRASRPTTCYRSSSQAQKTDEEDEAEAVRQKVQSFEQEAERKKQEAEREVDDMLADLKKRLKKQ